jgi:hypothetical protein
MNMPTSQNRSNCAFRYGFLRLATETTAQSGLKNQMTKTLINHPEFCKAL